MTTPTLTADQAEDLQYIGENDIMGSRLQQSALDDGGESLIALGLAEARHGRIRLTLDGLDALDELRRA